jgi:autotransporter translocation and assembly factor TamB
MLQRRISPAKKYLRRTLQVVAFVCTIVIGIIALALIASQTPWFKDWLRRFVVREANQYVNGNVSVGSLGGDLFYGIQLGDVSIEVNGERIVTIKRLEVKYSIAELISNGITVRQIRLDQPFVLVRHDASGWNLSNLVKKQQQEADRQGPGKPMTLPDIEIVDGRARIDDRAPSPSYTLPKTIAALNARAAYAYEPVHYSLTLNQFSFAATDPSLGLTNLTGRFGVRNDDLNVEKLTLRTSDSTATIDGVVHNYLGDPNLAVTFAAPRVSLPELSGVLPELKGYALHPAIDLKAEGKQSALTLTMNEKSEAGNVSGRLVADVLAPNYAARGDVSVQNLNLAPVLQDASDKSDITAHATLDVTMAAAPVSAPAIDRIRGHVALEAPTMVVAGYRASSVKVKADANGRHIALDGSASAYGGNATAKGTIVAPAATGQPMAFDVGGAIARVNLSQLPAALNAPRVATNLNVQRYHVKGEAGGPKTTVDGDAMFGPSTIPGGTIVSGTTAQVSMTSAKKGGIQSLTYTAHGGVRDVNLQTVGHAFSVAALDKPDYDSRINADVDVKGSGTTAERMDVQATGTVTNTEVYGGSIPQLAFDAHMANNAVQGRATGSFSGFDPARIAGNQAYAGRVNGTIDATFGVANLSSITADGMTADGKVTLAQTNVAGLQIDTADVEGNYANRRGTIRQASVKGPDLDVTASGPIALDESGQTNVTLHAAATNLADIGKLVKQPISGTATVDATVTGNATSLKASGTLDASNVAYQQDKALKVTSRFDATVPNLTLAQAQLHADTTGTFIDASGFHINTLAASTTYSDQKLDFQTHVAVAPTGAEAQEAADTKQPNNGVRQLDASGSVIFHPDHQEIHLPSLTLRTQGVQWQTAPGSAAAIQYGNDRIQLQGVRLVNGNQSLSVDGAFSLGDTPSSAGITITAQNVDISQLEQLAMQNRGLTGTLNANATIAGDAKAPDVKGHVDLQNGGFKQFKYQSFSVDGGYQNQVATIDAKLVQQPGVELTAKGTAPLTAFEPNPHGVSGHVAPSGADSINVHIQSTNVGLGIVQGFTDQVNKVTGTVQADVTVTGSGHDPHIQGYVAIDNASFAVPQAGTHFSGLTTRIELEPDRVHIPRLQIADNNGSPMTIEGDLAVHATNVGAVNVSVQAHDFKLVDNELGKIAVDTNLRLTGDLQHPRLEGDVQLPADRLQLDQVLLMMSSPYATQELPPVISAEDAASSDKGAEQATHDALAQGRGINAATQASQNAGAQSAPGATGATGVMAPLTLNVHFVAPNDFVVRGNDLRTGPTSASIGNINMTVGADLFIQKQPDAPMTIRGTANTVRGFYEFEGRRFTVRRDGSLRFDGLPEINPSIDVSADRLIPNSGVTATVHVTGTAKSPKMALTSDPPLDESDILSLIVFNQNVNELGSGQRASLAETAAGIASGFVANSLGNAVGKALDVDLFEITTSDPETGETAGGVTLGKQLTDKAFVQYKQQFGDRSFIEFMMEYQLAKFLRADVEAAPETSGVANRLTQRAVERAGVDLIFFFSY